MTTTIKSRVVFLGTPQFAVPILEALMREAEVVLVVTQPDRKAGRGKKLQAPPVKELALAHGIPVVQPDSTKGFQGRELRARIETLGVDFLVTAAYGRILGRRLLQSARIDALNVHASLLPKYRGAAPINHAIVDGNTVTGVSIMRMEPGLDAGPVFLQRSIDIEPSETAGALTERLAELGAEALAEVLARYSDYAPPQQQDPALASHAPMLCKEDGLLDWSASAEALHNRVRGFHPWPCAQAIKDGQSYKIHRAAQMPSPRSAVPCPSDAEDGTTPLNDDADAIAGTIVAVSSTGIDVACGRGVLRLLELQAPGKKRLSASQFLSGSKWSVGDRFD